MKKSDDFEPTVFEPKWAKYWMEEKLYRAKDFGSSPKSYVLIEFPYPSGERLHVGHGRSYACLDAVARLRRMRGMNVLYPFGWDAFGLPAENYAIKTDIHPAITTRENIARAREQAISWGLSFDWDREIDTTDPNYYKWTQWIFVQLFKKGLAYKEEVAVNWCPSCKTNLANEEVVDGKCERCGTETERRKQSQWMLRITAYAQRLLDDLKLVEFREDIAASQINWIGRKVGRKIKFGSIEVFTTKPETVRGATFVVLSPEHPKVLEWADSVPELQEYLEKVKNLSDREREASRDKTGVDTGQRVVNPVTGESVPVWVADYVMATTGTGAIMGVPAGDERDLAFAKNHNLPIVEYQLERNEVGEEMVTYHLRDWVFSRQHYWGEPIPMIFCPKCAEKGKSWFDTTSPLAPLQNLGEGNKRGEAGMAGWFPVDESDLPVQLPQLEKFQPSGTGESPLARVDSFVNTLCPKCGQKARRETDTMPNWAGSSWYFLRYIDPHNSSRLADPEKLKYWLPVDWYNGGMEHTTLHLLYSRFWQKVLFDMGEVPTTEPYAKRTSHGVVLGPDGRKMSKSRGNVINPDDVVKKYGADTLRMYEMFIGPFDQMVSWSWEGVEGTHRFLKKIWKLAIDGGQLTVKGVGEARKRLAKLTKRIEEDLEETKFNTAVAAMMEFGNWWNNHREQVGREEVAWFLKLLAVMAPFISEELYQRLQEKSDNFSSIHSQNWPGYDQNDLVEDEAMMVIQVNGKVRGKVVMAAGEAVDQEKVVEAVVGLENVAKYLKEQYKVVFVPGKIVNFIVE